MTQYQLYNRLYNYRGGYGHGDRKKIHDITADRFEQNFFPPEEVYAQVANDMSGQYVTPKDVAQRIARDLSLEKVDPRHKLPEDYVSSVILNEVPPFGWSHPPDATLPGDYKQHDQIKLYQQAFYNAYRQDQFFNDPRFFDDYLDPENPNSKKDVTNKGLSSGEIYSMDGSAAGRPSNHLGGERRDESYRENSIESMVAF